MDWSKEESLDFAIYNLVVAQKGEEFTADQIVNQLKEYNGVPEERCLERNVLAFLECWVDKEMLQQHWNSYSLNY